MASEEVEFDYLASVADELKEQLGDAVHNLYLLKLDNASDVFFELLQEVDKGSTDQLLADDLAKKLAMDLIGYARFEDAVCFLNRVLEKRGKHHFRSLLNCSLIAEAGDDHTLREDFNNRLLQLADQLKDITKQILAKVLIASHYHDQAKFEECKVLTDDIVEQISQREVISPTSDLSRAHALYMIVIYEKLSYLYRKQGEKDKFKDTLIRAIQLSKVRGKSLGLSMQLETYLIRALKIRGEQDEVRTHVESLLASIEQAMQDVCTFALNNGIKVLREAFNDVSVASSFHDVCGEEVVKVGQQLFSSLLDLYGEDHHEVIFVASQMLFNYESLDNMEEADRFLDIVLKGLGSFGESTKMIMQVKAKTLIHLWKLYRSRGMLEEAEYYCREEIRVNKKHGLSQQYVANALRNLAFIVKEQDRWEEGLNYLKECLKISKEFNPSLTVFHEKVANEIRKF